MSDENTLTAEQEHLRKSADFDTAFARQVIRDPHIVIAREEDHADTAIGEFGQFAQCTNETFRNNPAVFEPEIEDIPDEEDRFGVLRRFVEPGDETPFGLPGESLVPGSEVYVGCEIIHVSLFFIEKAAVESSAASLFSAEEHRHSVAEAARSPFIHP